MRIALPIVTFAIGFTLGFFGHRWLVRFAFKDTNAQATKSHARSTGISRHEQLLYGSQAGVLTSQEQEELERLNARYRHPSHPDHLPLSLIPMDDVLGRVARQAARRAIPRKDKHA